jgi:hypothetical protein
MRIMAEDNLLAVQPKSYVATTNSDHEFEVYLNLANRMKLTGINQLWGGGYYLHSIAAGVCLPSLSWHLASVPSTQWEPC